VALSLRDDLNLDLLRRAAIIATEADAERVLRAELATATVDCGPSSDLHRGRIRAAAVRFVAAAVEVFWQQVCGAARERAVPIDLVTLFVEARLQEVAVYTYRIDSQKLKAAFGVRPGAWYPRDQVTREIADAVRVSACWSDFLSALNAVALELATTTSPPQPAIATAVGSREAPNPPEIDVSSDASIVPVLDHYDEPALNDRKKKTKRKSFGQQLTDAMNEARVSTDWLVAETARANEPLNKRTIERLKTDQRHPRIDTIRALEAALTKARAGVAMRFVISTPNSQRRMPRSSHNRSQKSRKTPVVRPGNRSQKAAKRR
jgi:hypothetical protein